MYKRQVYGKKDIRSGRDSAVVGIVGKSKSLDFPTMLLFWSLVRNSVVPVSYTHLDVYKRQAIGFTYHFQHLEFEGGKVGNGGSHLAGQGVVPVSYTHLAAQTYTTVRRKLLLKLF